MGGKGLHWCGIGVAIPEIHTGTSLRRPEARGRAWYMFFPLVTFGNQIFAGTDCGGACLGLSWLGVS